MGWIKGGGILQSPAPQISFTEAQEEMCHSIHFCFGSGMVLGHSAQVRMPSSLQLSVLSAEVEESLAPRAQTSRPLAGLREGKGVWLQLPLDVGEQGYFISLPLLSA